MKQQGALEELVNSLVLQIRDYGFESRTRYFSDVLRNNALARKATTMKATVYINGNPYEVEGVLYSGKSGNGFLSINQWTKIAIDVLHVYYPRNYGVEKNNYYRLKETDRWVPSEELEISPEEIKARDVNRPRSRKEDESLDGEWDFWGD